MMNMGMGSSSSSSSSSFSQIPHMIMFFIIITIFLFLSLQSTHILTADASLIAAEYFKVHSLEKLDFIGSGNENKNIQKVAGGDEIEEKETLIVQKFRALLGLRRSETRNSQDEFVSPAPSPSPTEEPEAQAPAPAPAPISLLPIVEHPHSPPLHHSNSIPPHHKILKKHRDNGKFRSVLAAVLISAVAAFILCVLGLMWASVKFRQNKKIFARTMSWKKKRRTKSESKYLFPRKSDSKVSLNPGLDLVYLDSLERDLEQHDICLKQTPEVSNTSPNHSTTTCTVPETEESNQEFIVKSEFDNASSSSSTREIVSVHEEDLESPKYESDDGNSSPGEKIVPLESFSSDDESFHSFVDSHSSNIRLSNASAGSLTDILEFSPSNAPKSLLQSPLTSFSNPQSPKNLKVENVIVSVLPSGFDSNLALPPPPPPPPPPPLPPLAPSTRFLHLRTSSSSTRTTSKGTCSSPLSNISSPRNSDLSSGSLKESPATLQAQSKIPPPPCLPPSLPGNSSPAKGPPPPPCPPPFLQAANSSAKGQPPPPPPFIKGNGSSTIGPPPPPSLLPQYAPLGKDGVPLPKLKRLHWDKVRAAPDRSMVWDKIRSNSFELDEEMIESLFGYNLQCTMKNDEAKSKTPSPSKHVLEPKRLQNFTIISKALNSTPEEICQALLRGDGLTLQQLEALAKMVPTKEEEAKLADYKGDINELGSAEKFVKLALTIPYAFLRVEVMLYRETFEDEVVHLRNSFSMLEEACKELRSSRLFLKLLEAVLKTGNRMNVGTIRGGARAFKLDALLKLADVKGTDGKTTLLHFVVQEIIRFEGIRVSDSIMGRINQKNKSKTVEEREENYRRMGLDLVSGLSTELYNVKKTATIDLDVIASSVSNLKDGMAKLQKLVLTDLSMDEKSANFVHSMKTFMNYAQRNLKQLQEDEDRVLLHVRQITEYFHGNVSKEEGNPLKIFVIVRDFLGMLDHVCKELRSIKITRSPNPLAPFR